VNYWQGVVRIIRASEMSARVADLSLVKVWRSRPGMRTMGFMSR
jgi:hypothetical protein